jgi:hypothetical protein
MSRLPLFLSIALLMIGCGPTEPTRRYMQVGWVDLVHTYRDRPTEADRLYRGHYVQVYLPAQSYQIMPDKQIASYFGINGLPGALVFECLIDPPPDNKCALLVSGICRGQTRDGIERANGITWFVRIDLCRYTQLSR